MIRYIPGFHPSATPHCTIGNYPGSLAVITTNSAHKLETRIKFGRVGITSDHLSYTRRNYKCQTLILSFATLLTKIRGICTKALHLYIAERPHFPTQFRELLILRHPSQMLFTVTHFSSFWALCHPLHSLSECAAITSSHQAWVYSLAF